MNFAILGGIALLAAVFFTKNAESADTSAPAVAQPSGPAPDPWTRFDDLFHKYGDEYGVDWTWLKAFCLNESNLGRAPSTAEGLANPNDIDGSKSSDGKSWGIMQVTLMTGRQYDDGCTPEKLNDPDYSVNIAAQLIADNMKQFSQNDPRFTEWVVKAYNEGAGNVKKEIAGAGGGYSDEYWTRWQKNLNQIEVNPT